MQNVLGKAVFHYRIRYVLNYVSVLLFITVLSRIFQFSADSDAN